ncbi:uncharacterized protein LOC111079665 [Drosophila obscura]|uniref:uncharacterized protein LOC111079665 n=1 Tax=Drosophila obscura TaxID=7282 RepID=UPI001BB2903B|nr:uncharacterized protein LOC111079665 [Drosophila obscura]
MNNLEYVTKRIACFHCELHTSFGYFIKAATCMAFGVILGWIMSLVALAIYKMALVFGAKSIELLNDDEDEPDEDEEMDMDMELLEVYWPVDLRERQRDAWLEAYSEARQQHQHLLRELAALNQSTLAAT